MNDNIGDRIRAAREAAGFTQEGLAAKIGTQWQQVSRWERNENVPRPNTLRALAIATGSTPEWIRTGAGVQPFPGVREETTDYQAADLQLTTASLDFVMSLDQMMEWNLPQNETLKMAFQILQICLQRGIRPKEIPRAELAKILAAM